MDRRATGDVRMVEEIGKSEVMRLKLQARGCSANVLT